MRKRRIIFSIFLLFLFFTNFFLFFFSFWTVAANSEAYSYSQSQTHNERSSFIHMNIHTWLISISRILLRLKSTAECVCVFLWYSDVWQARLTWNWEEKKIYVYFDVSLFYRSLQQFLNWFHKLIEFSWFYFKTFSFRNFEFAPYFYEFVWWTPSPDIFRRRSVSIPKAKYQEKKSITYNKQQMWMRCERNSG